MKKIFILLLVISMIAIGLVSCSDSSSEVDHAETVPTLSGANIDERDQTDNFGEAEESAFHLDGTSFKVLLLGTDDLPFQEVFRSLEAGVTDAAAYVNANGGVYGAELMIDVQRIQVGEDDLDEQILEIIFEEDPHLVLLAVPVSQSLYTKLNGQSVPVLYFGVGGSRLVSPTGGRDNLFWLTPLPDEQMAFVLEVLRSNWKSISPVTTYPEMISAYFSWEGELGQKAISPEMELFLDERAFQLAVKDVVGLSPNSNVANAIVASMPARVGVIYTDTFSFGPAVILNDLHSLGMGDFFVLAGSVWGFDGVNQENMFEFPFEGEMYVPRSVVWWSEEAHPAIQQANEVVVYSERDPEELNFGYLLAVGAVDLSVHVLKLGVSEEGDGAFLARDLYPLLDNLEAYPVLGGLFVVDYGEGNRAPSLLKLWRYEGGVGWSAVSDWETVPDLSLSIED